MLLFLWGVFNMEKSEIEDYLRDIWVREFEKEEKLFGKVIG